MAVFKCKMCGGDLEVNDNMTVGTCQYCGSTMTIPKIDDDKRANLYNRANHFRRNSDFDKAIGVYESILSEDSTDPEAYWGIVLCKYGVDYVEDPKTHKRVITCHRTQYTSVLADEDYKSALEYADLSAKSIYEKEASIIENIQKKALAISNNEEPFDVFICYKEVDAAGKRTQDSVLAQDIYYELTEAGYKVFFSRITLEDKIGQEYEPYIFAALNSAKVMVALGTKVEYFNAVWVKNEWSRFLSLIKNGENKVLIPAYKDIDPYDLPEEFGVLQAQDMSKLGFIQDLIRGIKKLCDEDQNGNGNIANNVDINQVDALIDRMNMFLEDGDLDKAEEYAERALDLNPRDYRAYLCKVLIDYEVCSKDELIFAENIENIENNDNYIKAIKFANGNLKDFQDDIAECKRKLKEEEDQEREEENRKRLEREEIEKKRLEQERLARENLDEYNRMRNEKLAQRKAFLLGCAIRGAVIGLIIGVIYGTIFTIIGSNNKDMLNNLSDGVATFIPIPITISFAYGRGKLKGFLGVIFGTLVGVAIGGGVAVLPIALKGFGALITAPVIAAFCGLMVGIGILSKDK